MIKICGITSAADALAAAAAGADAVGFVFAPRSPRRVSAAAAAAIAAQLPAHVLKVGVFANADPAEIRATADAASLDLLQLHGREPSALARYFAPRPIWKALHMGAPGYLETAAEWGECAAALLLDSGGGTGRVFDWRQVAAFEGQKLIIAGGLTPENVAECIARTGPWGVDVSSGVESAPGRKDPARVRDFIRAAQAAFASLYAKKV
ncbi:MAG TPA: phosphoribosylanthranilate isomerase [Terriglobales bacterium]|nr:phosphoribosylanthranilate isomerase [Terriglobales bacterium]